MVHVALFFVDADGVDHLVHARHPEGGHVEDLGLAPLEQARAVSGRDYAHPGTERPQVTGAPAVDAHAFLDDPLAHQVLGEGADGCGYLLFSPCELV